MEFQDYMPGEPFSKNNRNEMKTRLLTALNGQSFDLVFTHSRSERGEYWGSHANHVEVREVTTELATKLELGPNCEHPAYFAYDVIYKGGTATCARLDANYYLPLTYSELLWKCQLSRLAPDANSSLSNLCFPCPNPEGFEGDQLRLPKPFVNRVFDGRDIIAPTNLAEILRVQSATEMLLRELGAIGFKSKRIEGFRFSIESGTAAWYGIDEERGIVTVFKGCTPGAIAHELGHAFHECLRRDRHLEDKFGEDYAEAIRWFVEDSLGWRGWQGEFKSRQQKDDRILKACDFDWSSFKTMLTAGHFYPN